MPDIIVTLSQEEFDAMGVLNVTPQEWAQNAVSNRARKIVDDLVTEYTDKNPNKMSQADKHAVIPTIDLAAEKVKRHGNPN